MENNQTIKGVNVNGNNDSIIANNIFSNSSDVKYSKQLPKWVYWVWIISIFSLGFSITCCFKFIFPFTNWNVSAVSVGFVLGFVGILATIVLINNYSQVQQVKQDTKDEIAQIINKTDDRIRILKSDFDENINRIDKLQSDLDRIPEEINKRIKEQNEINNYRDDLYYNTLQAFICYYQENYYGSLVYGMRGLYNLNMLNKNLRYSFEDITHSISLLDREDIISKIEIADSQKTTYINILEDYNGHKKNDFIKFINKIKIR